MAENDSVVLTSIRLFGLERPFMKDLSMKTGHRHCMLFKTRNPSTTYTFRISRLDPIFKDHHIVDTLPYEHQII